jgi:hypothetical protein
LNISVLPCRKFKKTQMKDKNSIDNSDENFSENIQFENELLKLKLRAEFGAARYGSNAPPEIENFFLKNVLAFEKAFSERKRIRILEKLGSPTFKSACELSEQELADEFRRLNSLLKQHAILLSFSGNYTILEKYEFLTQEFFEHQIDDVDLPNFTLHFQYEEFLDDDEDES